MPRSAPLVLFLLVRAELELLAGVTELLLGVCKTSPPAHRKHPRDPLSAIPVRQDLSVPMRQLRGCFEAADLQRLQACLTEAREFARRFKTIDEQDDESTPTLDTGSPEA